VQKAYNKGPVTLTPHARPKQINSDIVKSCDTTNPGYVHTITFRTSRIE